MKNPIPKDPLSLGLALLVKELRSRLQRHPQAHLLARRGESVELRLRLPTEPSEGWLAPARDRAASALDSALRQLVAHRSVVRPGRVYCLRCASTECEHSAPTQETQVFAGYGPSGLPRFHDLGQWLLERRESRVDQLYRRPPALIAHVTQGDELVDRLLPAFREKEIGYKIRGQVAAGWYTFPTPEGFKEPIALTFQVVSTRSRQGHLRLALNLLGSGPRGEPLENLFDLAGELPWSEPASWAQRALAQIERWAVRDPAAADARLEDRLRGLLEGLARRLERQRRSRDRRTRHGRERHQDPGRPTWKALEDAGRAGDDQILFDTRHKTLVVLGDRGRAHVFNLQGKMVTSIRYSAAAIERRQRSGVWRPATEEEVTGLRRRLPGSQTATGSDQSRAATNRNDTDR